MVAYNREEFWKAMESRPGYTRKHNNKSNAQEQNIIDESNHLTQLNTSLIQKDK